MRPTSGMGYLRKTESGDYLWRIPGRFVASSVGGDPTITVQPVGGTFVAPHVLTVVATGAATLTYQWQGYVALVPGPAFWQNLPEGSSWTGTTTASLTLVDATTPDVTPYRVIVTNSFGSVTSDTANVETT